MVNNSSQRMFQRYAFFGLLIWFGIKESHSFQSNKACSIRQQPSQPLWSTSMYPSQQQPRYLERFSLVPSIRPNGKVVRNNNFVGGQMFSSLRRTVIHSSRRSKALRKAIGCALKSCCSFQMDDAADRVTIIGSAVNLALSAGKFGVGVTCHSTALVSDAMHSLSDLISDFVTLATVRIGRMPSDASHPNGYVKYEAIGSLILSLTLLGTGLSVGAGASKNIFQLLVPAGGSTAASVATAASTAKAPGVAALFVAFLSVASKEWLYRITKKVGDDLNSTVLVANAKHHRSDAFSSVLAMGSIGLAMSIPGMLVADSVGGLFVACMIGKMGVEIMTDSIKLLKDERQRNSNNDINEKVVVSSTVTGSPTAVEKKSMPSIISKAPSSARNIPLYNIPTINIKELQPSMSPTRFGKQEQPSVYSKGLKVNGEPWYPQWADPEHAYDLGQLIPFNNPGYVSKIGISGAASTMIPTKESQLLSNIIMNMDSMEAFPSTQQQHAIVMD